MIEKQKLEQNHEQSNITHDAHEVALVLQKSIPHLGQEDSLNIVKKIEQAQNNNWINTFDKLKHQVEQITEICDETWVDAETLKDFFLLSQEDIDAILKEPKWKLEEALITHQINIRTYQKSKEIAEKQVRETLEKQKAADKAKEAADKAKISYEKNQIEKDVSVKETEKQKKIENFRATNSKLFQVLQKTPLNLSDEQLNSVTVKISEQGKKKLAEQWITDPEKTYKQYVYALQNPDQMTPDMKNILAGQDPKELLRQFNADYWAESLTEKSVDRKTYNDAESDRKMDGHIVLANDRPRNKLSFRSAFAAFERNYFDPGNKLQNILNTSLNTHLGQEWMWKDNAGGKWPRTLQDDLEDISLSYLQKQTLNFQDFWRKDIQYLLQGVVKEDRMKQTGISIMKFVKACKDNPSLFLHIQNTPHYQLSDEQKQLKMNMMLLNRIVQQRFLKETRQIAKKQVAEMYFWQIADAMEAWGENIIMDTDMEAVTYDDKWNMLINYHTQRGISWQMIISLDGKVTITDIGAKQATWSADKNNNVMQRATYTLPWKLVSLDVMMQRVASHKKVFVDAWKENISQKTYDTTVFQEAVEWKENKLRSLSDDQLRTKDLVHSWLNHTLHTTRVYNSLINFATPYQEWQQDPVLDYFSGKSGFIDKWQYVDERGVSRYESLFAIRDMCANSSSDTIERFEFAIQRLQQLYTWLPKEQNPFFNEFAKEKIWKLFDYFRTTDQKNWWFDTQAFEKFVQQITIEKPKSIQEWLTAKEDRLTLIPLQSPYHKQLETFYSDKDSEQFLAQNFDKAYPPKK